MKRLLKIFMFGLIIISSYFVTMAQDNISIIPNGGGSEVIDAVNNVSQGGKVMEIYKEESKHLSLEKQFSSGIMNWDTILNYSAYLAKFLGQVALLIGAFVIIYLGYEKIIKSVLSEQVQKFGRVVLGIVIVIFAYVIVKLIWSAFIS